MTLKSYILLLLFSVFNILFTVSLKEVVAQTDPPVMMTRPPQNKNIKASKERLAINYYSKKEYEKAAVIYKELYDLSPRLYYYNYYLNCLINLTDYKGAEKLIRKHKRTNSAYHRLEVDHAYVSGLMGNEKKSRKIINDLINNLPQNKSLVIQIASALQGRGYFEDALLVYETARSIPDQNYRYNLELASAYQYTGNYEKMFDVYLEHLNAHPEEMQIVKNKLQVIIKRDVNDNLSGILKKKLLEKSQRNSKNLIYSEMLLWHAMQTKDFDLAFRQARAIDLRFEDREEIMLEVADVALSNKQYGLASKAYLYIKDKKESSPYYLDAYTGYFVSIVKEAEENLLTSEKAYKNIGKIGDKALEELGINPVTIEIAGYLSHIKAFKLGEIEVAISLLEQAIEIPAIRPDSKSWLKLELADILLFRNKVWDATLLYSQIETDMKNEPIGHEAKFRNARLFYYIGEYTWAKTKLDILKSATSKLIANDALELSLFIKDLLAEDTLGFTLNLFSKSDLYAYQGNYDSAFLWLTKIENQSSRIEGYKYMIYKKAGLMEKVQKYVQADSLYNYLATYYPQSVKADNAIFKRAELNRLYLHQPDIALDLYLKLMKDHPESIYAGESRKKYRELRKEIGLENDLIIDSATEENNNP